MPYDQTCRLVGRTRNYTQIYRGTGHVGGYSVYCSLMTKMMVIVTKVVLRQPTELVTFKESPNSAQFSVLE